MSTTPGRTVLADRHAARGARTAPFAGWELPLAFAGTLEEHAAVRADVGAFDVSHLGAVWVEGPGASAVVDATFTNDAARLGDGQGQYTLLCDGAGGIVDDLLVFRVGPTRWLAMPNAANAADVVAALETSAAAAGASARIGAPHGDRAIVAVQGPRALAVVGEVLATRGAGGSVDGLAYLGVREVEVDGDASCARVVVCRSGYTGERGAELVVPGALAPGLWDDLLEAGAAPCGLGARDTLRLEMGYPLHGDELSTAVRPAEAQLGWAVRPAGRTFPGRDALTDAAPPTRLLWGLLADGRRPARGGMTVLREGRVVGRTTSGTVSPTLGRGIALAFLEAPVGPGDRVEVDVRGQAVAHEVVRTPFVDRDPR